jgi:hypothetical protein
VFVVPALLLGVFAPRPGAVSRCHVGFP